MRKNLYKTIKPDLKHFKIMAKAYANNDKDKKEFWEYLIAYSENEKKEG